MENSMSLIELATNGQLTNTGAKPKLPIRLPNLTDGMLDVYRIPLKYLYYNNENGRIASAISRFDKPLEPSRNDEDPVYNQTIERMVVEDNEGKLNRTKKDIKLEGQKQYGYVLADGRVIDGNRRYTALRQLERETGETHMFEAVILPFTYESKYERAEIKRLELAIQMGVEERLAYDPVDLSVDIYQTVIVDQLLSQADYAREAKISKKEVSNKIETVNLMQDFLKFINAAPNAFHIIKDTKLYTPLFELAKKLSRQFPKKGPNYEQTKITTFALLSKMLSVGEDTGREIREYFNDILSTNANSEFNDCVEDAINDLQDKLEETTINSAMDLRRALESATPELREINAEYVQKMNRQNRGKNVENFMGNVKDTLSGLQDMQKGDGLIGNLSFKNLNKDQIAEIREMLIRINLLSKELIDIYDEEI